MEFFWIPEKVKDDVRKNYKGFEMWFSTGEYTKRWMDLEVGIPLGCTISPILFVLAMEVITKAAESPGGTHIFDRMGMCRPNGALFYKKSLNMGPVFCPKKSLNMGQLFWQPQITWFSVTLKDGYGFWGSSGTPLSNSNLSTPPELRDLVRNTLLCPSTEAVMNILTKLEELIDWSRTKFINKKSRSLVFISCYVSKESRQFKTSLSKALGGGIQMSWGTQREPRRLQSRWRKA